MNSFTKIIFWLLPLQIILLIVAVHHLPSDFHEYLRPVNNAEGDAIERQVSRHQRAIKPAVRFCRRNQYYDPKEGRCVGLPGGGKVVYINNRKSCHVNILKPHCTNPLYYYICTRHRTILAQCIKGQIFDNRFQRCIRSEFSPNTIPPHEYHDNRDHVQPPRCTRLGRFPMPDYCFMFYECDTNGHRFIQNVFKCPLNTGYRADHAICAAVTDCINNNSAVALICAPNASVKVIRSLSTDEVTEKNVEEISKSSEEGANDSDVSPVDVVIEVIMDESTSDLNPDRDASLTPEINDTSTLEVTSSSSNESAQNGNIDTESLLLDSQVTSSSTVECDDTSHSITTPAISTKYVTSSDVSSDVDNETTDAAYLSTNNYTSSSELHEGMQNATTGCYGNDENRTTTLSSSSTEMIDLDPTEDPPESTTNDILSRSNEEKNITTEEYESNDNNTETISNSSITTLDLEPTENNTSEFLIGNVLLYEEETDVEQYENNSITILLNTEAIDLNSTESDASEFLSINDILLKLDEDTENVTEEYRNDDEHNENIKSRQRDSDSNPTVSSTPEYSLINYTSSNFDGTTQVAPSFTENI